MTRERVERRLAAILAADVAGFSALMERDEEGTYSRIGSLRREVIEPRLSEHQGRLIKTTGDGFLAEFASPIEALRCALAIQSAQLDASNALQLRIGLNLGDVIIEQGGDVYGEGVNLAARLEGLADPGGILISGKIHSEVEGKVTADFQDRGEQKVKNIARPVRVYAVWPVGMATTLAETACSNDAKKPLQLPDKPSIAVLPFQNMSGDPEQEYFADGMAEDIITALSMFQSLFVIARNSSFTYKGKAVDIRQVGRELGVRYILEGSVRKSARRVRITGQLIEVSTNGHLWADKFDGALDEVFDLQDRVTSCVVSRLVSKLEEAELARNLRKPTNDLDGYDLFLRGMAVNYHNEPAQALKLFESAISHDPRFAAAHAMAAASIMIQQGRTGLPLSSDMLTAAVAYARRALQLGPNDAFSLARSGHVLAYLAREYDLGLSLLEQAVNLNPNLGLAWFLRGNTAVLCSEFERAVESYDRIVRLSPLDPLMPHILQGRSFALAGLDRYDEGYTDALRSLQFFVGAQGLVALITSAVYSGRMREANEGVARLLQLEPKFRLSLATAAFHTRNEDRQQMLFDALRKAGLPE